MDSVTGILQTLVRVAPEFVAKVRVVQEHERDAESGL